jgi:hypothetical protein
MMAAQRQKACLTQQREHQKQAMKELFSSKTASGSKAERLRTVLAAAYPPMKLSGCLRRRIRERAERHQTTSQREFGDETR